MTTHPIASGRGLFALPGNSFTALACSGQRFTLEDLNMSSRHMGNMTVTAENAATFPPIAEFFGHLTVTAGAHLVAPNLQMIRGWLTLEPGARLEAVHLGEIKGWLTVGNGCVVDVPLLRAVERDVSIATDAFYSGLLTVGSLRVAGHMLQMDSLAHISGSLTVMPSTLAKLPSLEQVSGSITLKPGAYLGAEKLRHIGGFYDADETAKLVAPAFLAS